MEPIPDRAAMNELRRLDKRLGVKWNGHHFVITFARPYGEPVNLFQLKAEDGSWRQINKLDVENLRKNDLCNVNMNEKLTKIARYMEDYREKRKKDVRDEIRNRTKDDRIQLSKIFSEKGNLSKNNHQFRRIIHKPKGRTATQILAERTATT